MSESVLAGARGYILKTADAPSFLRQVQEAAFGKTAMSPEVTSKLIAGLSAQGPASRISAPEAGAAPTPREQQVLDLISRGFTNKQMAEALAISENTVRAHVRSLMQKLRVDTGGQPYPSGHPWLPRGARPIRSRGITFP